MLNKDPSGWFRRQCHGVTIKGKRCESKIWAHKDVDRIYCGRHKSQANG